MNKRAAAAVLAVLMAAPVAACTNGGGAPPSQGPAPAETGGSSAPTEPTSAPTKLPEDLEEEVKELGLNERGNVTVSTEEPAEFKDLESGTVYASIAAKRVETDFACAAPDAPESINGQYVAIEFDVDAAKAFAESGFPTLNFSVHEFRVWDADGDIVVDPVGNAEACISAGERVRTPLEPGDDADGLVILDVPKGSGSAAFVPGGFEGAYGWEWSW